MVLENIIAQRKSKVIYRDNDKAVKVFDKEFSKADILNEDIHTLHHHIHIGSRRNACTQSSRFPL